MRSDCCVVIPVYKSIPDEAEIASLKQVISVLGSYPITLICSKKFDVDAYVNLFQEFGHNNFSVSRFNNSYFVSIEGYNKLMLSPFFYGRFKQFEFILIYQLDAWVFKDELKYWCGAGYDYIGAPWFEGFNDATEDAELYGVGNGGLSLRRTSAHIKALTSFATLRSRKKLLETYRKKITLKTTVAFLLRVTIVNSTFFLLNDFESQEDHFWGLLVPRKFKWFKIPSPTIAMRFSMEINAERLYQQNNQQLPFGCHAWEKYDPEFWKQFIQV